MNAAEERLLAAIVGDSDPKELCRHLQRFIAFYVDSPVTFMEGSKIGCVICEIVTTQDQFDEAVVRVMKASA